MNPATRAAALDQELQAAVLHFSETWEDPRSDARALRIEPGETLVCVTAAGCTPLSLLCEGPGRVVCIDYNPAQRYLLELKMAAIRRLPRQAIPGFLAHGHGVRDVYPVLRELLPEPARDYWDSRLEILASGVARSGRATRIFYRLGRFLGWAIDRDLREKLFTLTSESERVAHFQKYFDHPTIRWSTTLLGPLLSHPSILNRLLPASYFPYATMRNIPRHLWRRIEHVMTRLPTADNYFLSRILLGCDLPSEEGSPPYLQERHFADVRRRLCHLEPVTADLETGLAGLPDRSVDGFQLSNVFEWMTEAAVERVFEQIVRTARPGARLVFRNLFTERSVPRRYRPVIALDDALSRHLEETDRSLIYGRFLVCTIPPDPQSPAT